MRHFRRPGRWRQIVILICLPYLLGSVFVDFVHVHRQVAGALSAGTGGTALTTPSSDQRPADNTCTVCFWLRTWQQVSPNTAENVAAGAGASAPFLQPDDVWPDSPAARPALLRGPPSNLLA